MAARLSFGERARVEALRAAGLSVEVIAQQLGRAVSTIYRELKRNHYDNDGYDASAVQRFADLRARRHQQPKLVVDRELAEMVHERPDDALVTARY